MTEKFNIFKLHLLSLWLCLATVQSALSQGHHVSTSYLVKGPALHTQTEPPEPELGPPARLTRLRRKPLSCIFSVARHGVEDYIRVCLSPPDKISS